MTKQKEQVTYLKVYKNGVFIGEIQKDTEIIANLVGSAYPDENLTLVNSLDEVVLTTIGDFLDSVPDKKWLNELTSYLIPIQMGEDDLMPVVYSTID